MVRFGIGDTLVHPLYGVGTVVSIEQQAHEGAAEDYYVIELRESDARLATPVQKAAKVGLRKLASKRKRGELWKLFTGRPRRLAADYRKRRADIARRLRQGSFEQVGWVVRDLAVRSGRGEATTGDRRLLKRAKEQLAVELAATQGMEVDESKRLIDSALEGRLSRVGGQKQ